MTRPDPRFRVIAPQAVRQDAWHHRNQRLGWALILGACALGLAIGWVLGDRVVMPL